MKANPSEAPELGKVKASQILEQAEKNFQVGNTLAYFKME
jgi:hypothetical protein